MKFYCTQSMMEIPAEDIRVLKQTCKCGAPIDYTGRISTDAQFDAFRNFTGKLGHIDVLRVNITG